MHSDRIDNFTDIVLTIPVAVFESGISFEKVKSGKKYLTSLEIHIQNCIGTLKTQIMLFLGSNISGADFLRLVLLVNASHCPFHLSLMLDLGHLCQSFDISTKSY